MPTATAFRMQDGCKSEQQCIPPVCRTGKGDALSVVWINKALRKRIHLKPKQGTGDVHVLDLDIRSKRVDGCVSDLFLVLTLLLTDRFNCV